MARGDSALIKYEDHKRPVAVFEGDSRLDGRGYEVFRSVCGSHHCLSAYPRPHIFSQYSFLKVHLMCNPFAVLR